MHVLLVSPSIENLPGIEVLQNLNNVTINEMTTLEYVFNNESDLIIFDTELGVENILQQYRLYSQQNKSIKWLVINLNNIHQSLQYLQAGASGILATLYNRAKLEHCIQTIFEGQLYLEDDLIQILALRQIKKMLLPFSQLTAREFDVFCLLAEGCAIQMIAGFLSITSKTAFNCRAQIRKKLVVKDQQQLLNFAKKHRLII
jgi:two-component system invasion response regulator UvrY